MRAIGGLQLSRSRNSTTNIDHNSHNNDPSANATPTRQRQQSRPPIRPPLKPQDNNAMMRVRPKAPPNMSSSDKHYPSSRPPMPALSASAKISSRAIPLTPKVAATAARVAPRSTPATTPAARRGARSPNNSITPSASAREDHITTPVSSFLSNNVTPRSGSRKVRVDSSTNTTPTGTPVPHGNDPAKGSHGQEALTYGPGLGISSIEKDMPKRQTVSFDPDVLDAGYPKSPSYNGAGDSKFFFASEAKAAQPSRPPLPTKASSSSFLYARGGPVPPPPRIASPAASIVGSMLGEERSQSKFFHANGTPDIAASPSPSPHFFPPPRPGSALSSSSRAQSPRVGTLSPGALSPQQRPASPSKLNQYGSLSALGGRNQSVPSPVLRPGSGGRGQSANSIVHARRSSSEAVHRTASHGRSSSVGSDLKPPPVRKISTGSYDISAPGSPLSITAHTLPTSTPEEGCEEIAEGEVLHSLTQSPIKSGHTIDELNELAANARRERKVLDLQITNSSLEAINRTLEREMRKQTAELRRYKRLSRAGRLSSMPASRDVSGMSLSIPDAIEELSSLSDMSEEEDEDEEEEFSEEDTSDEGSLSSGAMAESDARHRQRDERRLHLDLSKHQQLLVDSQKMNQSLRRCVGLSEDLIRDAKKALAYSVRVEEIAFGGRVLDPDEVAEREKEKDNEGMSDIGAQMLRDARERAAANAAANAAAHETSTSAWCGDGRDDRDSGIELDGAQRSAFAGSPQ